MSSSERNRGNKVLRMLLNDLRLDTTLLFIGGADKEVEKLTVTNTIKMIGD
jgi:hypothetical protein